MHKSNEHDSPTAPLTYEDLLAHFRRGEKPAGKFRIGVEHEKIAVVFSPAGQPEADRQRNGSPVPYAAEAGKPQLRSLLQALTRSKEGAGQDWQGIEEDGNIIALKGTKSGGSVTLEPGGQFELSAAPFDTASAAVRDLEEHLRELLPLAEQLGIAFVACGFRPLGTFEDVTYMPKGRYRVMREYLPKKGTLGVEMMKRTATVQANLDYKSEADALEKLRVSISLSSLITAMFAASPLRDGKPAGQKSVRAACWLDTDNDRCGLLPFLYGDGASFKDYAEWALDVPMFFVYRHKTYHPVFDLTFRRFMREGWQGHHAVLTDWDLHLSTLFPESRLRQYVEVRGADSGPMEYMRALPCLWRGVLYHEEAMRAAWELVSGFSLAQREQLRKDVPSAGMAAQVAGQEIGALCVELVKIAQTGLRALGSPDEAQLLEPLLTATKERRAPADHILDVFHQVNGEPTAFVEALRYRP